MSVYHCLLTASTLAFGFDYPWDDTVDPHSLPGFSNGWRWDDGFVDALARFAGFSYLRFDGTSAQEEVLSTMKRLYAKMFENDRAAGSIGTIQETDTPGATLIPLLLGTVYDGHEDWGSRCP